MKLSREEKRARLEAKAGKVIAEALEWEEQHPEASLTELEDIILRLRKELGKEMAQMMLEEREARAIVPGPKCSKCGEEMRYKGQKGTRVESRVGELELERGHYYCPKCKESIFPPG
jgi:NADH pyrophosphatase NudC (nudix superfamily)